MGRIQLKWNWFQTRFVHNGVVYLTFMPKMFGCNTVVSCNIAGMTLC